MKKRNFFKAPNLRCVCNSKHKLRVRKSLEKRHNFVVRSFLWLSKVLISSELAGFIAVVVGLLTFYFTFFDFNHELKLIVSSNSTNSAQKKFALVFNNSGDFEEVVTNVHLYIKPQKDAIVLPVNVMPGEIEINKTIIPPKFGLIAAASETILVYPDDKFSCLRIPSKTNKILEQNFSLMKAKRFFSQFERNTSFVVGLIIQVVSIDGTTYENKIPIFKVSNSNLNSIEFPKQLPTKFELTSMSNVILHGLKESKTLSFSGNMMMKNPLISSDTFGFAVFNNND